MLGIKTNVLTVEDFLKLYASVGWEPPCEAQVQTALQNSLATFTALEGYIRDAVAPGWAVSLELISTKEAVPFYLRMGFEERPCEWDGHGMRRCCGKSGI